MPGLACLAVIAVSIYFRCYRLFEPWSGGHNGWGGVVYGLIARNYLKFGYRETMLAPVLSSGIVPPDKFEFYYHHPPLQVWLMSVSYWIFGNHEYSARLVPLLFSLLSMALVFVLAKRYFGREVALLAAVMIAVMPLEVYYAVHTDIYGSQSVFFSLLAVYGYLRWLETSGNREFGILMAGIVLGCLSSWYGFFLIPPILIRHRSRFNRLWVLPAAAIAIFLLFLFHRQLILNAGAAEQMGSLTEKLAHRMSLPGPSFILLTLRWSAVMYTPILMLLTAMWLISFARGWSNKQVQDRDWAVMFFLVMGTLHNLAFSAALRPHNYLVAAYTPAIALGSAIVLHRAYHWAEANFGRTLAGFMLGVTLATIVATCGYGTFRLFRRDDPALGLQLRQRGEDLARNSKPADTVLLPPATDGYELKVLRYYSDRNLVVTPR